MRVAFPPEEARSLAQAFSEAGWRQIHIAETEKYAHVTYFFNGGVETPYPGEERRLIPSPRVATYDLAPEMSAAGVTDALVDAIEVGRSTSSSRTTPTPDMVGHTGVWEATRRALAVARRLPRARRRRGQASSRRSGRSGRAAGHHGRPRQRRQMRDDDGASGHGPLAEPGAARRSSGRRDRRVCACDDGVLADVAPTLLELHGHPPWPG